MTEEVEQEKKHSLHFTQKWSIAAAVLGIMHQAVALCFWFHYAPYYSLIKTFSTIGLLFTIVKITSCILVLTPSCIKNPASARKWRIMTIPLFMVQIGNTLFIVYFCLFLIIRGVSIWLRLNYDNIFWTLYQSFLCAVLSTMYH